LISKYFVARKFVRWDVRSRDASDDSHSNSASCVALQKRQTAIVQWYW
jgi:hypothetical protein